MENMIKKMKFFSVTCGLLFLANANLTFQPQEVQNNSPKNRKNQQSMENVCGNNKFEPDNFEECDSTESLGCKDCLIEPGYICYSSLNEMSFCKKDKIKGKKCGNGKLQKYRGQQCDDGNLMNGDGCSSECFIEQGWNCSLNDSRRLTYCVLQAVVTKDHCGNGYIQKNVLEQCDDGNNDNFDGCSNQCRIQEGFNCEQRYLYPQSKCTQTCENGIVEIILGEQCDDGNSYSGDGCSKCKVELGWSCSVNFNDKSKCKKLPILSLTSNDKKQNTEETSEKPTIKGGKNSRENDSKAQWKNYMDYCGNGMREYFEECDDSNKENNDGCNKKCQIEMGWTCNILKEPNQCFLR